MSKPRGRPKTKTLRLTTASGTLHELNIRPGVPLVAGRGEDTALRFDVASVSRTHCRFEVAAEEGESDVIVVDLESQNGTFVNGRRVNGRAPLRTGDQLRLGKVALSVEVSDLELAAPRKRATDQTLPDAPAVPADVVFGAARARGSGAGPGAGASAGGTGPPPAPGWSGAATAKLKPPTEETVRERLEELGLTVLERIERKDRVLAYRARRKDPGQDVLVKAVLVSDYERAERLLREARLAAKVRHRNIVSTYDVFEIPGMVAIVLERVEGRSLAQAIASAGKLAAAQALGIGLEVGRALAHAHAAGVIHRNITPRSVILAADGGVKVIDFALAKSLVGGGVGRARALTQAGRSLGDLDYVPPEQRRDAASVDERADVYGLGATLYHALAGVSPRVSLAGIGEEAFSPEPAPLGADIPGPARAVVARCLRSDREGRYQTADELVHALEGALALIDPCVGQTGDRLAAGGRTGIFGRVRGDDLAQLLQVVEINNRSGYLEVFGGEREGGGTLAGTVVLGEGKILDARTDDARGKEAVFELLLLRLGSMSLIFSAAAPAAPAGAAPLLVSPLLLEACRRRDEASSFSIEE